MKNKLLLIVSLCMLLLIIAPVSAEGNEQEEKSEYAWVFIEANDYENADKWAASDAHESYIVKHSYARGVYTASTTYEGDDPYDQGRSGTLSVKAVFSGVPQIIYPNEPVTLKFTFDTLEDSVVALSFSAYASANFDQWDIKPGGITRGAISFKNEKGEDSFKIVGQSSVSYSETLTASLGQGSEDSKIALRLGFYMGVSMGTNYVYQWEKVADYTPYNGSLTADPNSLYTLGKGKVPIEENWDFWDKWSEQAKQWTPEDIEEAKQCASTVKFGDLHGEVWVLRGWEEDQDQFMYVDFDTPIYHGDLIVTRRRSGAILSFSDMSTFIKKENTSIVMDIKNEKTTKIGHLAGVIWVNLKKMVKDGSMEVEMSQAIAGARGTTFICEEIDDVSTLKVIEGTVEFTNKISGEAILVSDEQMISADENGSTEPIVLDVDEELTTWDEQTQNLTREILEDKGLNIGLIMLIAFGIALIAGAIMIIFKRKKPNDHNTLKSNTKSKSKTMFCEYCGSPILAGSKFCEKCGKPINK